MDNEGSKKAEQPVLSSDTPKGDQEISGAYKSQEQYAKAEELNQLINSVTQDRKETKKIQTDIKEQKSYIMLGFIILTVMVVTLLVAFLALVIQQWGEKITADYELTHAVDLLQVQMQARVSSSSVVQK